ncbi:protein-L-isoaspartate(D-aspartate) O-methyltransferase [Schistosoma bovis]|uniref:protein-L-isoaspartate(D-aspartate) O-methyltransferase n=1 Tax=Schistosoma bovis TaxID=6184 RepID=A0A430Q9V3_SCHBO|nr:protein-L-isoaspartate(D-aspartate) O-methyltransferase [Schistosoma bovis]
MNTVNVFRYTLIALTLLLITNSSMAWKSSGSTHTELINNLFRNRVISSEIVKNTMLSVDRGYFARSNSYEDRPSSIGYAATISAPHMVGPTGVAVGIEHIDELTKFSLSNVENWFNHSQNARLSGIELGKQLKLVTGDGREGWPSDAPYDAIHVGAAAPVIPNAVSSEIYFVT